MGEAVSGSLNERDLWEPPGPDAVPHQPCEEFYLPLGPESGAIFGGDFCGASGWPRYLEDVLAVVAAAFLASGVDGHGVHVVILQFDAEIVVGLAALGNDADIVGSFLELWRGLEIVPAISRFLV